LLSDLTLSGIEWEPGELNPYRKFRDMTPAANIGGAILAYRGHLDLSGVVAAAHIARAMAMLDNKPLDALAEAQAAVALTPKSVRAHLTLARALAQTGQKVEARQELQTALALANQAGSEWYPLQIAAARSALANLDRSSQQ
jgi:predicted Zn-dependent protease